MAGFVKLDTGILTSSLWVNRDQRDVFITTLLLAEPFEVTEPMAQLQVDSLEETGFVVMPGWYGFARAAGPGIVRTSGVREKEGYAALRALGSEDPDSRSQEHGGRRMVRVNGGYILLNYFKYRDRDYTAADRSKRYREQKKKTVTRDDRDATRDGVTRTRNVTQAEAEAEAEKDKSSGEAPPDVPREAAKPPAAAPGGAKKPKSLEKPGSLPEWLKQDLECLGVNAADQVTLHKRLGTLPLRAAVVQVQRKGGIRKPAAVLLTKGAELAQEGAAFLAQAAKAAEAGAPGLKHDRGWLGQSQQVRSDPEIRAAWAVLRSAEEAVIRARGGGGELEALDTVAGARRQLNGLLVERGGQAAPPVPASRSSPAARP